MLIAQALIQSKSGDHPDTVARNNWFPESMPGRAFKSIETCFSVQARSHYSQDADCVLEFIDMLKLKRFDSPSRRKTS